MRGFLFGYYCPGSPHVELCVIAENKPTALRMVMERYPDLNMETRWISAEIDITKPGAHLVVEDFRP